MNRRRRRALRWLLSTILIAGLAAGAVFGWDHLRRDTTTELATAGIGAGAPSRSDRYPTKTVSEADDTPLVGAAAVAGLPPRTRANPRTVIDNRVFVLGDSVMQGATPLLDDELPDWSLTVDTKVGRFLDEGVKVLEKRHADLGDIAVILMGNNYNGDEAAFRSDLDAAMTALTGVRHVIFLTVTMYDDDRAEVNDALADLAAKHPTVTLVDWGAWCDDNVKTFLVRDRLHLKPEGATALAQLVGESVTRVTRAAGERPAPGRKKPDVNTSGTIPKNQTAPKPTTRKRSSTTAADHGSGAAPTSAAGAEGNSDGSSGGASGNGTPTTRPTATTPVAPPVTSPPATPPPATASGDSGGSGESGG